MSKLNKFNTTTTYPATQAEVEAVKLATQVANEEETHVAIQLRSQQGGKVIADVLLGQKQYNLGKGVFHACLLRPRSEGDSLETIINAFAAFGLERSDFVERPTEKPDND